MALRRNILFPRSKGTFVRLNNFYLDDKILMIIIQISLKIDILLKWKIVKISLKLRAIDGQYVN